MSTATMSSNQHRRFANHPPPLGPPNKRRKEIDGGVTKPSSPKLPPPRFNTSNSSGYVPRPGSPRPAAQAPPAPRNQLLAGYLAHEFLTKGTLFGEPWDPARAEAFPVSRAKPPSRKVEAGTSSRGGEAASLKEDEEKYKRYVEVADLLKSDGAHLPGIVNPTQLARFLQL